MNKLMDEYHQNTAPLIKRHNELTLIKRKRDLTHEELLEKRAIEDKWYEIGRELWNKFRERK